MKHSFPFQGFCGWHYLNTTSSNIAATDAKAMQSSLNTSYQVTVLLHEQQTCVSTGSSSQLGEAGFATIIGSPSWKSPALHNLAQKEGLANTLITAYREYGHYLCDQLIGSYAFIISDSDKSCFLAATDKLARFPLYYHHKNGDIIFGSTAGSVLANSHANLALQEQGIYDYAYFHMVPSPATTFEGLNKLQSGKLLVLSNRTLSVKNHWVPRFNEKSLKNQEELGAELKSTLKESVARSIQDGESIGAFLSGGLDSSTVVGMMSELKNGQSEAFSIGFSAKGYDEMEYARITAKHFGVHLNEYYVTPNDVVDALPFIATSYDEPFGNSSALPAYFCAKVAKEHGITQLLAGDGGDELFAGNERYARQAIFENYRKIPYSLRNKLIEPVISALNTRIPLASKAKSYIEQANTPLPDRLQSYNFLHRHHPTEIFTPDFLGHIRECSPLELQRDIYNRPVEATNLNRMLYLDWQLTLADNDLRKVSQMCALGGVDVAYPMLDDNLIAFSCEIPSHYKIKGKDLRYFYKQALTGWLPNETIHKKKQGFGLPFGVWMETYKPLQEMAYDNLLKLKQRAIFRSDFIDQTIDLHRNQHAAYYGELVWILTVLELWMSAHY